MVLYPKAFVRERSRHSDVYVTVSMDAASSLAEEVNTTPHFAAFSLIETAEDKYSYP